MAEEDKPQQQHTQAQIEQEAIRRMQAVLAGAVPLMPTLPLVAAAALWNRCGGWQLGAWLLAALLAPGLRYLLVRRYHAAAADAAGAVRWANEVTVSALLDGLAWGVAGMLFLVPDSPALQMLLITMIVGTSAGSVFVTSFWPRSEYAFAIPSVGLTALGLALQGSEGGVGMAIGLVFFLGILYGIMGQAHGMTMETIRLQFEKTALAESLQQQKEVAEQASLAKTHFLAAASHDLRQPLHALGLFVTAMRQRLWGSAHEPLADRIASSVAALEGLLNALLDVSRLDAGVMQPQRSSVVLHDLLGRLGAEFAPLAQAKGLAWRSEGPEAMVDSDPALLETMLRNLLSNAVRYTPAGEVSLQWRSSGGQTVVRVQDTGVGIPPEHHRTVFREFFQLHNPERDRSKGLGLGLAVVERLGILLDHPLTLFSAPGRGTTFELALPALEAESTLATTATEGTADAIGLRVLVIDDEAGVRDAMALLLGDWGYRVTLASSVGEALSLLREAPQAIVADYRLRDERTGAEAIAQVRETWGANIPALIVTGDTAPDRLREASASGHPVLHKPVAAARLRAFLRHAVHAPQHGLA